MTKVQKLLTSAHVQRRKFQEFKKKIICFWHEVLIQTLYSTKMQLYEVMLNSVQFVVFISILLLNSTISAVPNLICRT